MEDTCRRTTRFFLQLIHTEFSQHHRFHHRRHMHRSGLLCDVRREMLIPGKERIITAGTSWHKFSILPEQKRR